MRVGNAERKLQRSSMSWWIGFDTLSCSSILKMRKRRHERKRKRAENKREKALISTAKKRTITFSEVERMVRRRTVEQERESGGGRRTVPHALYIFVLRILPLVLKDSLPIHFSPFFRLLRVCFLIFFLLLLLLLSSVSMRESFSVSTGTASSSIY